MATAIITPVGNEKVEDLVAMYQDVRTIGDCRWIVVVDESTNRLCRDYLLEIQNQDTSIDCVCDTGRKRGVAGAYVAGNRRAIELVADKIIEVDVGHPVRLVPKILRLLDEYPVVFGTRMAKAGGDSRASWYRKLISRLGTIMSRNILGMKFTDCTSGFQGYRLQVAQLMPFDDFVSTGHFYQTEFKYYCRSLGFAEIPFIYNGGRTSLRAKAILKAFLQFVKLLIKHDESNCITMPIDLPVEETELLTSIKEDVNYFIGKERMLCPPILATRLNVLLSKIKKLLEEKIDDVGDRRRN